MKFETSRCTCATEGTGIEAAGTEEDRPQGAGSAAPADGPAHHRPARSFPAHWPGGSTGPRSDHLPGYRRIPEPAIVPGSHPKQGGGYPQTRPTIRFALLFSRPNCCPISWTASPSPPGWAARSWPTTWAWARRSRAWARPRCWPAKPASARAGGLPGLAQVAVAQRNPPLLRPHRAAGPWRQRPRAAQYGTIRFFTVCNYEQVLRDILAIETGRAGT